MTAYPAPTVGRAALAHLVTGVLVVLALGLLGAGGGLLWHLLAPRTRYIVQDGTPLFAEPLPQTPVAADGWFAVIALVAGVLTGTLLQTVCYRWMLGGVLGLAIGSVLAAFTMWQVGHLFGAAAFADALANARDGTELLAPLDVHARGVLTLWPLAATLTVFLGRLIEEVQRMFTRPKPYAPPPPPQELPPIREEGDHTSSYPYAGPAGEQQ